MKRLMLFQVLGLPAAPANGLAWIRQLEEGLPIESVTRVAELLDQQERDVFAFLGLQGATLTARKRAKTLNVLESDLLFQMATAYTRLHNFKGQQAARSWLIQPCPEFKTQIPLRLLRTRQGSGYVMAAIERMRPQVVSKLSKVVRISSLASAATQEEEDLDED